MFFRLFINTNKSIITNQSNGSFIQKASFASLSPAIKIKGHEDKLVTYQKKHIPVEPLSIQNATEIERDNLEIVKALRSDPNIIEYESYCNGEIESSEHPFIRTVRGPNMVKTSLLCFYDKKFTEMTTVLNFGKEVSGHPNLVHGGVAATLLDDTIASVAAQHTPDNFVVTGNLTINYKKPMNINKWLVMNVKLEKIENRKMFLSAKIQSMDGKTIFVEATSLFVAPKKSVLKEHL